MIKEQLKRLIEINAEIENVRKGIKKCEFFQEKGLTRGITDKILEETLKQHKQRLIELENEFEAL